MPQKPNTPIHPSLPKYEPPTGDEPLDPIEQSWGEIIVARVVRQIREEEAARAAAVAPLQPAPVLVRAPKGGA